MPHAELGGPAFSIVLPTYNRAHVLMRAIESVLNQSFPDFELVVVDDFSVDGTWEMVAVIEDPRIRVVRNSRTKGASGARNTGIDHATGAWLCAIDSDDTWDRDFLLHLSKGVARASEAVGIVYGSLSFVEDGKITYTRKAELAGKTYPRMLHGHFFYHTASAFRTGLVRSIGGYDEELGDGEDTDLQLRLTELCEVLPVPALCASLLIAGFVFPFGVSEGRL